MGVTHFKCSGKKVEVTSTPSEKWQLEHRPGGWVIATSSEGTRVRLMNWGENQKWSVSSKGVLWNGAWESPRRGAAGGQTSGGDSDLIAQFPGKVRKICVKVGQAVAEGETLLLVESMKMEFAIQAPWSGVVGQIHVSEGQQLVVNDRYVDLSVQPSSGESGNHGS